MKFLIHMFIFFTVSCSYLPKKKNKNIVINIEKIENDQWSVKYKLPFKVKSLFFSRQTNPFRHKEWKVLSDDLEIKKMGKFEYVVSKSDSWFSEFSVEHKVKSEDLIKDYNFFIKYSDGDLLVYTGHYDVYPLKFSVTKKTLIESWPDFRPLSEFHFKIPNSHAVVLGKIHNDPEFKWIDEKGKGTYVYIGKEKPADEKNIVIVIDKKVPTWISREVKKYLPILFEYFTRKTDVALSFKPVVFLNYSGGKQLWRGNSGGTLPGLIQLTIHGKDWQKRHKDNFEHLFKFLAHEAAHLWNGQMFEYSGGKHSWMHEGGADAFAIRVMKDLGILNDNRYQFYINASLNECILGLDGRYPLVQSFEHRAFKNYYNCGATIALITELGLKSQDLFIFWKKLFENAAQNNYQYTDRIYLQTANELIENKKIIGFLENFIYTPLQSTGKVLKNYFTELKLKTKSLRKNGNRLNSKIARKLLIQLYQKDCNGNISLSREKNYYQVFGNSICKSFKKDFKVYRIGQYGIFKQAKKAYEFARKSCQEKQFVNLYNNSNDTIKVSCKEIVGPFDFFEI